MPACQHKRTQDSQGTRRSQAPHRPPGIEANPGPRCCGAAPSRAKGEPVQSWDPADLTDHARVLIPHEFKMIRFLWEDPSLWEDLGEHRFRFLGDGQAQARGPGGQGCLCRDEDDGRGGTFDPCAHLVLSVGSAFAVLSSASSSAYSSASSPSEILSGWRSIVFAAVRTVVSQVSVTVVHPPVRQDHSSVAHTTRVSSGVRSVPQQSGPVSASTMSSP
jgi:hypothetical protein